MAEFGGGRPTCICSMVVMRWALASWLPLGAAELGGGHIAAVSHVCLQQPVETENIDEVALLHGHARMEDKGTSSGIDFAVLLQQTSNRLWNVDAGNGQERRASHDGTSSEHIASRDSFAARNADVISGGLVDDLAHAGATDSIARNSDEVVEDDGNDVRNSVEAMSVEPRVLAADAWALPKNPMSLLGVSLQATMKMLQHSATFATHTFGMVMTPQGGMSATMLMLICLGVTLILLMACIPLAVSTLACKDEHAPLSGRMNSRGLTQQSKKAVAGHSRQDSSRADNSELDGERNAALRPYSSVGAADPVRLSMRPIAELLPVPSVGSFLAPELVVPQGFKCYLRIPAFTESVLEYDVTNPEGGSVLRVLVDNIPRVQPGATADAGSMLMERVTLLHPVTELAYGFVDVPLQCGDGTEVQAHLISGDQRQHFVTEERRNAYGRRVLLVRNLDRPAQQPVLAAQLRDPDESPCSANMPLMVFSIQNQFLAAQVERGQLDNGAPCNVLKVEPGIDVALVVLAYLVIERSLPPEQRQPLVHVPTVEWHRLRPTDRSR